jgi:hypothetical protein
VHLMVMRGSKLQMLVALLGDEHQTSSNTASPPRRRACAPVERSRRCSDKNRTQTREVSFRGRSSFANNNIVVYGVEKTVAIPTVPSWIGVAICQRSGLR